MKRLYTTVMAISAVFLVADTVHAQATLDSVRIEAKDTIALAKFYQTVFGMQEVSRW